MKTHFCRKIYHHRRQAESAISRNKRLVGSALLATSAIGRGGESLLRVLTRNRMLLAWLI